MTKKKMIEYLASHFRYSTLNSWNCSTSYALCVKINKLIWKDHAQQMKAYDFVDLPEAYEGVNGILRDFAEAHDWSYQICFNGRSSGYLVLIHGGYTTHVVAPSTMKPGERAYSDFCHRWFTYEEARRYGWLGKTWKQIHTQPGRSLDQGETFEDWSMDQVRGRYRLVRTFDDAVKQACREFMSFVEHHTVEEQVITVPKHIKVAIPN